MNEYKKLPDGTCRCTHPDKIQNTIHKSRQNTLQTMNDPPPDKQ